MAGSLDKLPHWNLDSIYSGLDQADYKQAKEDLGRVTRELVDHVSKEESVLSQSKEWVTRAVELLNASGGLFETLESYIYCIYSTQTTDQAAVAELNWISEASLPLQEATVAFRNVLGRINEHQKVVDLLPEYRFFLEEELKARENQMSPAEESLAADLDRSGGDAWGRLQQTISSTLSRAWKGGQKTVTELRALAYDADAGIREKAWEEELSAWKSVEIPLAAALNGVKGSSITVNTRRGWEDTLTRSVSQAKMTRKTLDAMISVMEKSLPTFRKYLTSKAALLGHKQLAFFDLFAPVGSSDQLWTWERCRTFICEQFSHLSEDYSRFAADAFERNWIDAAPRNGKVGGGYCTGFPVRGESRILCNFDGSFDAVSTVAHELGHAYHSHVLRESPYLNQNYPMTLAETASIFSETLVFNAALENAPEEEQLYLLETYLAGANQVIVDILSRFHFEKEVFRIRRDRELSPEEFCSLMLEAQDKTYGDGLDPEKRHPYMWAVKGHYYSSGLAFYNFPYAFGQLFGLGLYSLFEEDRKGFSERYRKVLFNTSRMSAEEVTRSVGFNIESPEFWQMGIDRLARYVERFYELSKGACK